MSIYLAKSDLLQAILRNDFCSFIRKTFATVNPGALYQHNWHIELIADYLQATESCQYKRLIINIPPRSLKSLCVSVAWPAWVLGHNPAARIMVASYSHMLSLKHSMDCRLVMSSDWYQQLFPHTILSKKHNQKSKFLTTENGFRFATSIGGSTTGEGGDILIIDDPHNPLHVHSPKLRNKVIDWFEQVFVSRLNNKAQGIIVLVMQRLHEEDLAGYLLSKSNDWHLLKIPIKAKEDIYFHIRNKSYHFQENHLLHSQRDGEDSILALEKAIGLHGFVSQYLQEPIATNHSLMNLNDIAFYDKLPLYFEYLVHSWDTAIKISACSDYSVCTTYGVLDNKYYLISMIRQKYTYPELKRVVEQLNNKDKPHFILIEDKASGQQLIQDLKHQAFSNIVAIKPKLDKITRFAAVVPLFQSHQIFIPSSSSFNNVLLQELLSFPNSKHDDIIDSISQFLNFAKTMNNTNKARIRDFT